MPYSSFACTDGFGRPVVLIGVSANIEEQGESEDMPTLLATHPWLHPGVKYITSGSIRREQVGPDATTYVFPLQIEAGLQEVRVPLHSISTRMPAGSTINVMKVLRLLEGSDKQSDTRVVVPLGRGRDGQLVRSALKEAGCHHLVIYADGTALTTTVIWKGGDSMLFCEKPGYRIEDETKVHLCTCVPHVLVLTGVKPMDMELCRFLMSLGSSAKRVVMPHCSLLAEQSRDNLLSLTQGACLVQINRHEASLLIGKEWQDNQDISKLAFLGADWVVVTLGCQGSVSMSRSNDVFVQGAYPVDAVDSCGAGDAHLAALIHYFILDGLDFARAAKIASWVASKNVTCKGPWSGIPSREQLLDFIQTNCM